MHVFGVRRMTAKREPTERQVYKHRAKAFVESISRKCFGYNYKNLTVSKHARRGALKYHLVIVKRDAINNIQSFHRELEYRFTEFKVSYTGDINSKTGREEWHIEIIVFGEFVRRIENEQVDPEVSNVSRRQNFNREPEAEHCI